ncbi:hypothetical protein [Pelagibius sp.]|nr:hypothetical protein [Pelagibius sp.]
MSEAASTPEAGAAPPASGGALRALRRVLREPLGLLGVSLVILVV